MGEMSLEIVSCELAGWQTSTNHINGTSMECRGILLHGEPGTGKTLVARALAGACAKHSSKPVAFFARKGADCLGKFAGEAERTLRLLFDEVGLYAPA